MLTGPEHFGAIIGRATIIGIVPRCDGSCGRRWHFHDQFGFEVRDARPVKPVTCRGYQGFWSVPSDVLEQLK